jgi:AraC-like DNA-binding protein
MNELLRISEDPSSAETVQRAKTLIQEDTTLADIAANTGFADQSHLNRQFKKAVGMTPLE